MSLRPALGHTGRETSCPILLADLSPDPWGLPSPHLPQPHSDFLSSAPEWPAVEACTAFLPPLPRLGCPQQGPVRSGYLAPAPPKLSIAPAVPRGLGPECRARSAEAAAGPFQEVPNRVRSALLAGSLCQGATCRTPQRVKVLEAWRPSRAAGLVQGQERQRRRCILMNHYCRGGLCLALSGAQ